MKNDLQLDNRPRESQWPVDAGLDSAILQSLPDAVIFVDNNHRVRPVNSAAEQLIGRSSVEVQGGSQPELFQFIEDIVAARPGSIGAEHSSTTPHPLSGSSATRLSGTVLANPPAVEITVVRDAAGVILGNVITCSSSTANQQLIEHLMQSRRKYLALLNGMNDGFVVADESGVITFANKALAEIIGMDRQEDLLGLGLSDLVAADQGPRIDALFRFVDEAPELPTAMELSLVNRRDGDTRYVELRPSEVKIRGRSAGLQALISDITERKRAEQQLRNSLEEKEMLLKEIHHRVKNNMQVVTSLLHLQSQEIVETESSEILKACERRVKSMALVHELLYESEGLARISVAHYTERLATYLLRSVSVPADKVQFDLQFDEVALGIDKAVPCGLIISELLANSLGHAFSDKLTGTVTVKFRTSGNGELKLTVSDNGRGLPDEAGREKRGALGLKLVKVLTDQLEGTFDVDASSGTSITVSFRE